MRIGKRRSTGHIIERGVRESLGPATGRNYLFQHSVDGLVANQPKPPNIRIFLAGGPGSQQGGGLNITGIFVAGLDPVDTSGKEYR
mgnify:FL=1